MADKDYGKDGGTTDFIKEPSSPKLITKKEKSKYQAFRSDDDDSSEIDDIDDRGKTRRKVKKERSNTFKVKIKKSKGKKKEKDKDKDKDKKKKLKKSSSVGDVSPGEYNDEPVHEPIFGVPLEVAAERSSLPDKIPIPRIIRECIIYIEDVGLDDEGLYRLSGVKSKVDYLKQLYDEGREVNLEEYDATTVASLLKLYLRELPSNILTTRLAPIFDSCVAIEDSKEQVHRYQQLINDLPCPNRTLLGWLFVHFGHVMDRTSETKMNIQNLSIVFSPTMSISHGVLNLLFTHSKELFPDIKIIRYEPPKKFDEKDLVMPDNLEGLQQSLHQNEEILADLHKRVNQGASEDETIMDELWERQRWSTQLKRKIKTLQKAEKEKQQSTDTLDEIDKVPPAYPPGYEHELTDGSSSSTTTKTNHIHANVNMVKENADSASRESMTDESGKALSVEDVTVSIMNGQQHYNNHPHNQSHNHQNNHVETSWKLTHNNDVTHHPSNTFVANFDHVNNNNFANFDDNSSDFANFDSSSVNELNSSSVIDTSQDNSVFVDAEEEVVQEQEEEYDDEYRTLLLEEKKLSLENEELLKLKQLISQKVQYEHKEIDRIKECIRVCEESKSRKSSSSTSSTSSRSSGCESNSSDSEETISELELIVKELEDENKELERQGKELVEKICSERLACAKIRSEIRLIQMTKAMAL